MGEVHLLSHNDLTRTLAGKITEVWDAYVRVDEETHSKYLTEDYRAVHPDGSVHIGRPTAAEIAAEPIEDYWLADLQAWSVGEEAAIASYTAGVEVRNGASRERIQFLVGEVWVNRNEDWKCRYYHATMLGS
jgi:Domain of unknown function (DUF4440)